MKQRITGKRHAETRLHFGGSSFTVGDTLMERSVSLISRSLRRQSSTCWLQPCLRRLHIFVAQHLRANPLTVALITYPETYTYGFSCLPISSPPPPPPPPPPHPQILVSPCPFQPTPWPRPASSSSSFSSIVHTAYQDVSAPRPRS